MMATFVSLNQALESVEVNTLNEMGHWPGFSTIGGALRVCLAIAEIVGSVAMIIFALVAVIFDQDTAYLYAELGQFYFLHGCANLGRGIIEFIPLLNLVTILHDLGGNNGALNYDREGRFSYINNQRINHLLQPA